MIFVTIILNISSDTDKNSSNEEINAKDGETVVIPKYERQKIKDIIAEVFDNFTPEDTENYNILETTEILNDITSLRNFKAENNIINSDAVKIEYLFDEKLYDGLIKFKNKVDNIEDSIKYESKYAILYFEVKNKVSEEDIQKEIEELEKSINKKKNLLSNENFVKRAHENIVANEKQKLIEEEEKLSKLKN